jgi:hypothetical protein
MEVINMTIKDRGKMKWHGAFFMPEHVKLLGNLRTDYNRTEKPQLDLYQYEEFDEIVSEAMAENMPIKVTVWQDGFTSDIIGNVHFVDPLTKQLRIEVNPGVFELVRFEDIINVLVNER